MLFRESFSLWPHQLGADREFLQTKISDCEGNMTTLKHKVSVLITSAYGDRGADICTLSQLSERKSSTYVVLYTL